MSRWARRFWNQAYRSGDHERFWEDRSERLSRRLAALVTEGLPEPVLVVGCGSGVELFELARLGVRSIGLDLALTALGGVRCGGSRSRRARRSTLVCASAASIPLASGSIGAVVDRGCFHALGTESRRRYGGEILRVLDLGGRVLLWGARRDDEARGVVGLTPATIESALPARSFRQLWRSDAVLPAPAGDLPATEVGLARL